MWRSTTGRIAVRRPLRSPRALRAARASQVRVADGIAFELCEGGEHAGHRPPPGSHQVEHAIQLNQSPTLRNGRVDDRGGCLRARARRSGFATARPLN